MNKVSSIILTIVLSLIGHNGNAFTVECKDFLNGAREYKNSTWNYPGYDKIPPEKMTFQKNGTLQFAELKRLNPGKWKYLEKNKRLFITLPKATKGDLETYQASVGKPGFNLSTPIKVDSVKKEMVFSNCKRISFGEMVFDYTKK